MVNASMMQTFLHFANTIHLAGLLTALALGLALTPILKLVSRLFSRITQPFQGPQRWIPSMSIRGFELISSQQIASLIHAAFRILYSTVVVLIFYLYLSVVFSFFPATQGLAATLLNTVGHFLTNLGNAFLTFLPNLFSIIAIFLVTYYTLRLLKKVLTAIGEERILFSGFHKEWAEPTYKLLRFLFFLLALVMVFPLLPGFDSPAFQGIGVFLGLLISLGSSTAIGNVIAGMVLIYMRSFEVGDRIKTNGLVGDVMEKTLLVTRLLTTENEVVTLPNAMILSHPILNYSEEADTQGLILTTAVTIGYDVAWPKVHECLLEAARRTQHLLANPEPHVFQRSLDDFYVSYELRATTRDVTRMAAIYSELHQHIQDVFHTEGIEILSPHYRANREGPTAIPTELLQA